MPISRKKKARDVLAVLIERDGLLCHYCERRVFYMKGIWGLSRMVRSPAFIAGRSTEPEPKPPSPQLERRNGLEYRDGYPVVPEYIHRFGEPRWRIPKPPPLEETMRILRGSKR